MDNRKEGNVISLHPQKIDYGRRRIVRAVISLLVLGALEEASTGFKGVKTAGQVATSLFKLIGEPNTSSETNLLSPETSIIVTFADVTFDPNLRVRESPKIIHEKYDIKVGNQNTEKNFSELVIENALIIKTDPRPITKVIHNTQVVETVYDEWIMFSYGKEVFFVKHGEETEGLIHFKPIVESEEKPQTEYTFDRFEKDHFGKVHIVVKNEKGDEMYVSRARLRTKADSE